MQFSNEETRWTGMNEVDTIVDRDSEVFIAVTARFSLQSIHLTSPFFSSNRVLYPLSFLSISFPSPSSTHAVAHHLVAPSPPILSTPIAP